MWLDSTGRAHYQSGIVVGSLILAGSTLRDSASDDVILNLVNTASAVNFVDVINSPTGTGPSINADGPDSNIDLFLNPAGTTGVIGLSGPVTTTAPGAGGGSALPATPTGYLSVKVGGTPRQIAFY